MTLDFNTIIKLRVRYSGMYDSDNKAFVDFTDAIARDHAMGREALAMVLAWQHTGDSALVPIEEQVGALMRLCGVTVQEAMALIVRVYRDTTIPPTDEELGLTEAWMSEENQQHLDRVRAAMR